MNPNEFMELIESSSALAEVATAHYDSFIQTGFNEKQALVLTASVLNGMLIGIFSKIVDIRRIDN